MDTKIEKMKEIMQITGGRYRDKIGRFGEYGGQYVPEIVSKDA